MENARAYAQEKLAPTINEAYHKEHFDRNILKEMGQLGFLGCTISEYGLPGVSSAAYGNPDYPPPSCVIRRTNQVETYPETCSLLGGVKRAKRGRINNIKFR